MWMMFALLASLATACFASVNQAYRLPAWQLMFWRGLWPAVVLAPLTFFVPAPHSPLFYMIICITAGIVSFTDARLLEAASRFGAGLPLRLNPVIPLFVFFLWLLIDPSLAVKLVRDPLRLIGIVLALVLCSAGLLHMTRCIVTMQALRYYAWVLAGGIFIDIFNKLAMREADHVAGPLYYAWVQSMLIFLLLLPRVWKAHRRGQPMPLRQTGFSGLLLGASIIVLALSKNAAMSFAPNPAYVSAIVFSSALWISLFARLRGHAEQGNVRAGLAFVAGAALLFVLGKG